MTTLHGKLIAETPIYRGNARKTLFTRDGDGTERLVSLAGEIQGTAQSLMDAFIGESRNQRNRGLLNELWLRLYSTSLPKGLITGVDCELQEDFYPQNRFFDLRMGIKLDEDRWAIESNANYKYETLLRNSVFDFSISVNEQILEKKDNAARLYYLLNELEEGRFWFGAGKSKGLGRVRLDMELPFSAPKHPPKINADANHLNISMTFNAENPVMVGWNWGKVDPETPIFAAIEGQVLVEAMRSLPLVIRERLAMSLGGPIISPEDWKNKLAEYLPRVIAVLLRESSFKEVDVWVIPEVKLAKLGKGRYPLSKKIVAAAKPLVDHPFSSKEEAEAKLVEVLEDKANMAGRIVDIMDRQLKTRQDFDQKTWIEIASGLGMSSELGGKLVPQLSDEDALTKTLTQACKPIMPRFYEQVDRQVKLLQSDAWIDVEISNREEHLHIKQMILHGEITERDWGDVQRVPEGISAAGWRDFLASHRRVRFQHMRDRRNLRKSIENDKNFIAFLESHRDKARQELSQPYHMDFRAAGPSGRAVSRKYGKPYDTIFMRMLSWSPSAQGEGLWEIYVPGSTIKGAFRKRASQVLRTLWGETPRTQNIIGRLFGKQGQRGLVYFSDAYLSDPLDPSRAWCSMDGVKMNSKTGQPVESAKSDFLFAYGSQLAFHLRLDLQDVTQKDFKAVAVLIHLVHDFQRGDIPLGGEKTSGFGWVEAAINGTTWLTGGIDDEGVPLFSDVEFVQEGIWHKMELGREEAAAKFASPPPLKSTQNATTPPKAKGGFISHRAFGGYCGMLTVDAEVLSPITVSESGEPSFTTQTGDGPVNGWDFFSMSPPEAAMRDAQNAYALPSKSIKGMLRHIYTIATDSKEASRNINNLNPADSLFGWVGQGPNQAISGRLSFDFGFFDEPELAWFKTPYPYGNWHFVGQEWKNIPEGTAKKSMVDQVWRIFPHTPLAPDVLRLDDFQPDSVKARYFRAILPGSQARFNIRFWNLTEEELQRLMWCVVLDDTLAHKVGGQRYLGFGSLRLSLSPESYLIDWAARYASKPESEWQLPLQAEEWLNPDVILHRRALQRFLNVKSL